MTGIPLPIKLTGPASTVVSGVLFSFFQAFEKMFDIIKNKYSQSFL
jgi:hypothetical protein